MDVVVKSEGNENVWPHASPPNKSQDMPNAHTFYLHLQWNALWGYWSAFLIK